MAIRIDVEPIASWIERYKETHQQDLNVAIETLEMDINSDSCNVPRGVVLRKHRDYRHDKLERVTQIGELWCEYHGNQEFAKDKIMATQPSERSINEFCHSFLMLNYVEELLAKMSPDTKPEKNDKVPAWVNSRRAKEIFVKLQENDILDENLQPLVEESHLCVIADVISERLGFKRRPWKDFALLWNNDSDKLRSYFNKALGLKWYSDFEKRLHDITK